jgi:hypothetical protein
MRGWGGDDAEALMASTTYYVALAFKRLDDNGDIVACDPKEESWARESGQVDKWIFCLTTARLAEDQEIR